MGVGTFVGWGVQLWDAASRKETDPLTLEHQELQQVVLSDRDRSVHTAVVGTTGTGKSWLLNMLAAQDTAQGFSLVVVDPKGDDFVLANLLEWVIRTGREKEFVLIAPYWDFSDRFNPLAGFATVEEVVGIVTTMLATQLSASGDSAFFFRMAQRVCRDVVSPLLVQGKTVTLQDVVRLSAYERLTEVKRMAEEAGLTQVAQDIQALIDMGAAQYAKVAGNLATGLHPAVAGQVAGVLLAESNPIAEKLLRGERVVVYIRSSSLRDAEFATLLTLASVGVLKALAGVMIDRGKALAPPLRLHVDEAARALFPGIVDFFDKGRSAGLHTTMYFQSEQQLKSILGEDARVVEENVQNWIVLRLSSSDTGAFLSGMLPRVKRHKRQIHFVSGAQAEARVLETEEPLIQPALFSYLRDREVIVKTPAGVYAAAVPTLEPPKVEVVYEGGEPVESAVRKVKAGEKAFLNVRDFMDYVRSLREEPQHGRTRTVSITVSKPIRKPIRPQPQTPDETANGAAGEANGLPHDERIAAIQDWLKRNPHPSITKAREQHVSVVFEALEQVTLEEHSGHVAEELEKLFADELSHLSQELKGKLLVAAWAHDLGKVTAEKGMDHPKESVRILQEELGITDNEILDWVENHHLPLNKAKQKGLLRWLVEADGKARFRELKEKLEPKGYRVLDSFEGAELVVERLSGLEQRLRQGDGFWTEHEGYFLVDVDYCAETVQKIILELEKEEMVVVNQFFYLDTVKHALAEALRRKGLLLPTIQPGFYARPWNAKGDFHYVVGWKKTAG